MGSVIVQNEMQVQGLRHRLIDSIEEATKLYRPMTTMKLADNSATLDFQRRKQRSGPVTSIVVTAPFALARPHRQHWLRAVQGLNLCLFVNTQNQGFGRRIEVQPHNITNLLDEQRIPGKFESFAPMGSQCKGVPDTPYGGVAQAARLRHRTSAPMRGILRCRLQGHRQHPLHLRITEPKGGSRSRFVQKTIETFVHKPAAPLPYGLYRQVKPSRHYCITRSVGTRQNHSRTLCQSLSRLRPSSPSLKSCLFFSRQHQCCNRSSSSHRGLLHTSFDAKRQLFIQRTSVPGH